MLQSYWRDKKGRRVDMEQTARKEFRQKRKRVVRVEKGETKKKRIDGERGDVQWAITHLIPSMTSFHFKSHRWWRYTCSHTYIR